MKAPYLILNGQPAEMGQPYWTVSMVDQSLSKHIAGRENNTIDSCYFDNEGEAIVYKRMAQLLVVLGPQIRAIEKKHQYNGFRDNQS